MLPLGRRSLLAVLLGVATLVGAAGCKEGDVKVTRLAFKGNSAMPDSRLRSVLATQASGWLPWSAKHYFDRVEFDRDLRRLTAFYADRGYPDARITDVDADLNDKGDTVAITIEIDEGAPLVTNTVTLEGVADLTLPDRARRALDNLPLHAGVPRDMDLVAATKDRVVSILRNNGYAYAQVQSAETNAGNGRVDVRFDTTAGPLSHFGEISINGGQDVGRQVVRRELTFKTGDLYRERKLTESQRQLTGIEFFEFAHVTPRLDGVNGAEPDAVPVTVTIAEAKPRQIQFSVGYGSEEHARAGITARHLNFLGGAKTGTAELKYSSLDAGGRATLGVPSLIRPGLGLLFTGSAFHTTDRTYISDAFGGSASLHFERDERGDDANVRRAARSVYDLQYVNEYLRYRVDDEALADLTQTSDLITLGLDPVRGNGRGTRAAVAFDSTRSRLDQRSDPRRGYLVSGHLEHAAPWLGGTFRYDEATVETRAYVPLGRRLAFAGRVHAGALFAKSDADVPFSQRYFLGGSTSIRGWGRYEISPLSETGIPIGGRRLLEMSLDVRVPLTEKITAVAFADAGSVWGLDIGHPLDGLRKSVGLGARYHTPVGAVRVDVGYQLNPIDGLLINGKPSTRRWRIHFGLGQAF